MVPAIKWGMQGGGRMWSGFTTVSKPTWVRGWVADLPTTGAQQHSEHAGAQQHSEHAGAQQHSEHASAQQHSEHAGAHLMKLQSTLQSDLKQQGRGQSKKTSDRSTQISVCQHMMCLNMSAHDVFECVSTWCVC